MLAAFGLSACGATGASAATKTISSPATGPGRGLNLARLSSLTNYRFTSTSSNAGATFEITGMVHGPEDWETEATVPVKEATYDVGGRGYSLVLGHVLRVSFKTPAGLTHLDGERTAAEGLIGYTHVRGIRITTKTKGSCRVAGKSGTTYHLVTSRAAASLLVETATACVAERSGALLSYTTGVPSGSAAAAAHVRGATSTFKIEAIGGVGPIRAPKASATTTTSAPGPAGEAKGLPSGFPSEVPAPPGTLMSGSKLSPTKWYLQLTEPSASAFGDYTSALRAKGFAVASTSKTAAGDLEQLTKGTLRVLVEQISLPGQGVMLTVTVQRSS